MTALIFNWVVLMVILNFSCAFAGTYWVHPSGNASWRNCESTNDPGSNYCSLKTANTNVKAGDTVYIKAGTYSLANEYAIFPTNTGTGVGAGRIIFSKIASEAKPVIILTSGSGAGILLKGKAYIKVDGIVFKKFYSYSGLISHSSHHNEIANCEFIESGIFSIHSFCGNNPETYLCNSTHNWIHHNTFSEINGGGGCNEGGDILRVGGAWVGDGGNNNNTIENNIFAHSGHANIDMYGHHYTVLKNNISRNEPWYDANGISNSCSGCGNCYPKYADTSYNNKWGHRNFHIGFNPDNSQIYTLVEGNRVGYQSTNPGNPGDANLTIGGPGAIVRYNSLFGAMRIGLYFKWVNEAKNGLGGRDARVYNNSIYKTGYGFEGGGTAATRRHGMTFDNYTASFTGNYIVNNIIYDSRDGDFGGSGGSCGKNCDFAAGNVVSNNWCSSQQPGCSIWGNPSFINTTLTPSLIATIPDLNLQSSSGAIDRGTHLTTAKAAGGNSTKLVVGDARYFQDGSWGSSLAKGITHFPDWIAIGTIENTVQISSINYETNTIFLASPKTWNNEAKVWLYKKSDGQRIIFGAGPDMGSHEYSGGGEEEVKPPSNLRTVP